MERASESGSKNILIITAVVCIAVLLRFLGLGSSSLTMNEAENALAALHYFENGGSGLLYSLPTAVFFKAFGSSEFSARFIPAAAGVLLSVLPFFLRRKIGYKRAWVLSFLLAVDPVLLFWSKRADAVIPSLAMLGLAAVLWFHRKHTSALACFLISLCGGERILPFVCIVVLCCVFSTLFRIRRISFTSFLRFRKQDLFLALLFFLLFCTAFGTFPGGLGGFGSGIVNSFRRGAAWVYPGAAAELTAVVLYCGIPLICIMIRSMKEGKIPALLLSIAGMAGLLLWHGIIMLPWISLLLWIQASDMPVIILERVKGPFDFPFFMTAFVIAGAWSFFYFRLVELFKPNNGNEPIQITWNGAVQTLPLTHFGGTVLLTVISLIILGLIIRILLGFVDSVSIRRGMLCGLLVILSWGLITGVWNAGGFDREGDHPLRYHPKNTAAILNGAYCSYTDTAFFEHFKETVLKHGDKKNVAYGLNFIVNDPMADWFLRDYPGFQSTANANADPTGVEMILDQNGISYETYGFVRADSTWRGTMDWTRFTFRDWGRWVIFGDGAPVLDIPVTLWARIENVFYNDLQLMERE